MSNKTFPAALVAAMLLMSLLFYPFLPEQVAIHWNVQGTPDQMAHKAAAVLMLPGLTLVLMLVYRVMMNAQFQAKYGDSAATHALLINAILLFLGFMHALTLIVALNPQLSIVQAMSVGMGGLFAVMGNVMGRLRPNPYFGFRFPWTMTDEEVWRRTHRIGGRWMFISGLVIMLAALVLPPELIFVVLMVLLLGESAGIMLYSRQLWQERHTTAS